MVWTQVGGAFSWSLMVWLTVGMYGCSIAESKQAMFTETPVTVPARCLKRQESEGPSLMRFTTSTQKLVPNLGEIKSLHISL